MSAVTTPDAGPGGSTRVWGIGAVVVALVAAASVAAGRAEPVEPPAAVVEPVQTTRVVCPDPLASSVIATTVSGFVAPGLPGQEGRPGTAALATSVAAGKASTVAAISEVGGSVQLVTKGTSLPPVVGTATGSLAPGFVADQFTTADQGAARGIAGLACAAPGTDSWFVGGGATAGRTTVVTLANPEDDAAQVDVLLYGPKGPVVAPGGRGVVVPAKAQVRLELARLAPGVAAFAVHVQVRAGRVSAAVNDREADGLTAEGTDWVPVTRSPGRELVVPGVPAGVSKVVLSVLAPESDATVGLRILSPDGGFVPAGSESVDAAAGQLVQVDVTAALSKAAGSLVLRSDTPVVAGVRYLLPASDGGGDFAYAAAAPVLTGPAAVSGLSDAGGLGTSLVIASVGKPSRLTLTTVPATGGAGTSREVTVPADTTIVAALAPPVAGAVFNVVVTPVGDGGQVYVARVSARRTTTATFVTGYPLAPVRATLVVPQASADLAAALPVD